MGGWRIGERGRWGVGRGGAEGQSGGGEDGGEEVVRRRGGVGDGEGWGKECGRGNGGAAPTAALVMGAGHFHRVLGLNFRWPLPFTCAVSRGWPNLVSQF